MRLRKSSHYERVRTLPNALSAARVLMAAAAAVLFFTRGATITPVVLCILAAILDHLDGFLARRWGQITRLGEHLDPLADKILVSVIFLALAGFTGNLLLWIVVILLLIREWGITWLREAYQRNTGESIPADSLGKWKMITQALFGNFFLLWLALLPRGSEPSFLFRTLLMIALLIILALSYTSGLRYFLHMRRTMHLG